MSIRRYLGPIEQLSYEYCATRQRRTYRFSSARHNDHMVGDKGKNLGPRPKANKLRHRRWCPKPESVMTVLAKYATEFLDGAVTCFLELAVVDCHTLLHLLRDWARVSGIQRSS